MNDEKNDKEPIDLSGIEEYEVDEDDAKSLKEKYENLYEDDAEKFANLKEKKDIENAVVINASYEKLKNRLKRRFDVYIQIDHETKQEEVEEEYIVEKNDKPVYENGKPVIKKRKIMQDVEVPILMKFETRRPTDKERFDIQRFGAQSLDDLAQLDDKEYQQANMEIANYLERLITKPSLTAEKWRNDIEQAVYQNLFFKIVAAGMQTDEASLIDFLMMY